MNVKKINEISKIKIYPKKLQFHVTKYTYNSLKITDYLQKYDT